MTVDGDMRDYEDITIMKHRLKCHINFHRYQAFKRGISFEEYVIQNELSFVSYEDSLIDWDENKHREDLLEKHKAVIDKELDSQN